MAKQTFTTGQVLTAANLTSLQQTAMLGGSTTVKTANYVLVAGDAGTTVAMSAAGATTITVNTSLFSSGDIVFIQNRGAGACTVTAGTATVATAGSLILPQNDAGILYFTATGASIFYDFIQAGAASPLTTKGDVYTFSTSDARLAVGTNGQVLTAASAEATGLKFATPSGAYTSIATGSLSGTSVTISSIDQTYKDLYLRVFDATASTGRCGIRFNGVTSSSYRRSFVTSVDIVAQDISTATLFNPGADLSATTGQGIVLTVEDYATTSFKNIELNSIYTNSVSSFGFPAFNSTTAITSITIVNSDAVSYTGGTYILYGVK